jgi:hypothetical protein
MKRDASESKLRPPTPIRMSKALEQTLTRIESNKKEEASNKTTGRKAVSGATQQKVTPKTTVKKQDTLNSSQRVKTPV